MAKINYSKAENLLSDALLKMSVKQLLQLADKASSFTNPSDPDSIPSVQARTILLNFMKNDIEFISSTESSMEAGLGISKKQIKTIIDHVTELTLEDWKKLKKIRLRVQKYKKELWSKVPHLTDEDIIHLERKKHVNKRFNTRDKWIPLH